MLSRVLLVSCAIVAGSAGLLTGCASPDDVEQTAGAAVQQTAGAAENAGNAVTNYAHHHGFWGHERAAFRRDVRRDERRDIRRDAARVAERRVREHEGWWSRMRHGWWR